MSFRFVLFASIAAVALGYTGGMITGQNGDQSAETLRVMRPLSPAPIMPAGDRTTKNADGTTLDPRV